MAFSDCGQSTLHVIPNAVRNLTSVTREKYNIENCPAVESYTANRYVISKCLSLPLSAI
jgi:hypothetical protein